MGLQRLRLHLAVTEVTDEFVEGNVSKTALTVKRRMAVCHNPEYVIADGKVGILLRGNLTEIGLVDIPDGGGAESGA